MIVSSISHHSIKTSCSALGVKELILQFWEPVPEEKKNYISLRTIFCSVTVFHPEGKIRTVLIEKDEKEYFKAQYNHSLDCPLQHQ